jgi:RHS repeat-associated protein
MAAVSAGALLLPGTGRSAFGIPHNDDFLRRAESVDADVGGAGNGELLNQSFGFDAFGKRWVTSANGSIAAPSYTPQAETAFDTATNRFKTAAMLNSFDAAGQTTLTDLGERTVDWDSEGRVVRTTWLSYTPTFCSFDGLGQRVKKANDYWGQYVIVYDAFGRKAAEYGAGFNGDCTTCYPVTDTVGALRLVLNQDGVAVRRFDWTGQGPGIHPYNTFANGRTGVMWDPATVTNVQFAGGYQRDDLALEPNVDFSGTRTIKRQFGRFWSPDDNLADQSPEDPLSWNLYADARGNPVRYSDPTGRSCVDLDDGDGKGCKKASVDPTPDRQRPGFSDIEPQQANVRDKKGTIGEWFLATNVPRYVPNDTPLSPSAQRAAQAIHDRLASLPNVCSVTVSAMAGRPGGPVKIGAEFNTDSGLASQARRQARVGFVTGRVTVTSNNRISTSIRIGDRGALTVGLGRSGVTSLGLSYNLNSVLSLGLSGQIGGSYSCVAGGGNSDGAE